MKKEFAIDRFIRKLIDEHLFAICMGLVLLSAVMIRVFLASNTQLSPDYDTYYREWVEFYRANGGLKGLEKAPGDYYVPFNVIYALSSYLPCEAYVPLSILPVICELVAAFFIYKIIELFTGKKHMSAALGAATLFLPFVVMDGALWKQVDAVYTCFLVICLYELLKENYRGAFIFYAIAFAFKLQAVLFLPLLVILYIAGGVSNGSRDRKTFSILEFLWIPVIYLIAGIPEVIAKHGLRATYFSYLFQTQEISTEGYGMVSFLPNLYNLGFDDYSELLTKPCIMLLFAVLVMSALYFYGKRENFDKTTVFYLAIWSSWTCLMLLPGMHERYDYCMLLLLTPFALVIRKKLLWPMIIANLCSLAVYAKVLFGAQFPEMYVISIFYAVAYIMTTIDFVGFMAKEKC